MIAVLGTVAVVGLFNLSSNAFILVRIWSRVVTFSLSVKTKFSVPLRVRVLSEVIIL